MNLRRTQTGRAAPSSRPGAALTALAAAQFTVMLATSIVNVALPQIRAGAALSDDGTTWVVNAYGLAFGALLLAGGRAADLLGRRRVLVAGLAVFAAASLAAGLAASASTLIAARAVQGLGAAAVAPAALALTVDLFPPGPGRGRALGVWGAVSGAGGAGGVLLGGLLTQAWGWPWTFHAVALGTALVLAAVAALVPRTAEPKDGRPGGRFDLLGTAVVILALTGLVWGLTGARGSGWTDVRVLGALLGAVVLIVVFAVVELRRPNALLPPRLFAVGRVAAGNLLMALLGSVWIALFFFLPLYQQQVLGSTPLVTGAGQLPLAAAGMLGSALAPRLSRRVGVTAGATASLLTAAAGLLWMSRIGADGSYTADVLGPSVLVGAGLSGAFVQLTALAVDGVPRHDVGLAGGLVNTSRQVGGSIGLAVLATLAGSVTARASSHQPPLEALTAGYRAAFAVSAAVLAATALLTPALVRRTGRTLQHSATASAGPAAAPRRDRTAPCPPAA
ncbi:MFS transporter [Streptomyces sp. NPDC012438]|uniref:MFS transporter n=1 Tax=Streptomyces sp. NPDC012438 TaxID=3364833 RepID=UPI0036EB2DB6